MWKVKKKKMDLRKASIFDSKLVSVKQSLVFQKVFTIHEEKKKYILGLKCLLAPRSLKRASQACGFLRALYHRLHSQRDR